MTSYSELHIFGYYITYEEKSKGDDTIVFLNGWSAHRNFWEPIIKDFYDLGRCISLDLPGHYPSLPPERFDRIEEEELIDIVAECIKKINSNKPVILVGHSAGGFATIGVTGKYPELIKKLIAVCPASHGPVEGNLYPLVQAYKHRMGNLVKIVQKIAVHLPYSMETFFSLAVHNRSKFFSNPAIRDFLTKYQIWFSQLDPDVLGQYLLMFDTCDIRPYAKKIQCHTLLITGRHDFIVPFTHARELASLITNVDFFVLEDSGHVPLLEEKEITLQKMRDWITIHK